MVKGKRMHNTIQAEAEAGLVMLSLDEAEITWLGCSCMSWTEVMPRARRRAANRVFSFIRQFYIVLLEGASPRADASVQGFLLHAHSLATWSWGTTAVR